MDPLLSATAQILLALLFARAALHKLREPLRFTGILADYRLLPAWGVRLTARALPVVEALVALAFLAPGDGRFAAAGATALLAVYSLAIGVNLARGRREIDCGCGGAADQTLHPTLIVRNAGLASLAIATTLPTAAREWTAVDTFTLAVATAIAALLWTAAELLAAHVFASPARRISS